MSLVVLVMLVSMFWTRVDVFVVLASLWAILLMTDWTTGCSDSIGKGWIKGANKFLGN
jgi:hypothetical protein